MRIKAAIVDYDGTLFNSFPNGLGSFKDMFKDIGSRPFRRNDERIIRETWGAAPIDIVAALFPNEPRSKHKNLLQIWDKHYKKREEKSPSRFFPGTNEALKALKNMGLFVAIATNRRANRLYDMLLLAKLKIGYVDFIIAWNTSCSFAAFLKERNNKKSKPIFVGTPYKKPDPRYLTKLNKHLAKREILPHEVIFSGDTLTDALTAKAGGYNFIPVLTGPAGSSTAWWESNLVKIEAPPLAIASSIKDLPLLIETFNRAREP